MRRGLQARSRGRALVFPGGRRLFHGAGPAASRSSGLFDLAWRPARMSHDRIPLAGVIGSPVAHSRSPQLHTHWLKTLGIPGFYIPVDVAEADLEAVLRSLPKMGFRGVNITVPHKERALALADTVTDRATIIGAANTLVFRDDGQIQADNTDGYGFTENLRQNAPGW